VNNGLLLLPADLPGHLREYLPDEVDEKGYDNVDDSSNIAQFLNR
jgi:hypothetical protein